VLRVIRPETGEEPERFFDPLRSAVEDFPSGNLLILPVLLNQSDPAAMATPAFCNIRNLDYLPPPSHCMQDIVSSKKMENGIVVFWMEKDEKKEESFNYEEHVDMKINALDLLERPKSYKVDKAAHKLIVKK
jgi:hypothetical protein